MLFKISDLLAGKGEDEICRVHGWVRSVRKSKKFSFVVISDGTSQNNFQMIVDQDSDDYENISTMLTGTSIEAEGLVVKSGGKNQSFEMQAKKVSIIGACTEDYPLQKKATSLEFLREHAHLRVRTNTFGAVFRIRHALSMATHKFFDERGFYNLHSPIVTGVDAEGAGEMFNVSTLDKKHLKLNNDGSINHESDYFGKETSLCVTGQLEAECFALGMGSVYTFGPTFRSENSNTPRHLAEFWMIEPEVAFADLEDIANLATDYVKYLIEYAIEKCPQELEFLHRQYAEEDYLDKLIHVRDSAFNKITYTEAIDILNNSNEKFEFPTNWGDELQTEHERFLAEKHFQTPVIVTDYPKGFKAFYMKQNDDGETVRAMDVLMPGIGELIGGSQREESLEKLEARMEEMKMDKNPLWWYLDLRKFGTVPHAGFGLGFERAVMYVTGMKNIRDVIPFPRTPKNCDF
ncbi:MAG: asparagine--tRNA ligase [Bacteriovoracaceae bacterium]|jgi:asparaginyl-tRNA synthetase|nr:asparagine--tRNA ligase [Bacteriovoracaceae bacterium]